MHELRLTRQCSISRFWCTIMDIVNMPSRCREMSTGRSAGGRWLAAPHCSISCISHHSCGPCIRQHSTPEYSHLARAQPLSQRISAYHIIIAVVHASDNIAHQSTATQPEHTSAYHIIIAVVHASDNRVQQSAATQPEHTYCRLTSYWGGRCWQES